MGVELQAGLIEGNVAVLMGGQSSEREISLKSGRAVHAALAAQLPGVLAIDVDADVARRLNEQLVKHVFIALHGLGGEDGTIQGMLEMEHISYTGSGVLASALAMDKLRCKQLWRGIGLPTPDFVVLDEQSDYRTVSAAIGPEFIVKPANEGSSIGMARVTNEEEFVAARQLAGQYDSSVFAEQWINGPEFTVAILGEKALPPIGLKTDNEFYDYEAKYESDETQYLCPCGLPEEATNQLEQLAIDAFKSLGCEGWGRVDFMQGQDGQFYLLEVNTVPGMTDHSLVPMAAKAAGMDMEGLVVTILNASLEEAAGAAHA
jgi:D-alanine-D-alanine ligase